jgi:hypothetical protein
VIGAEKDEGTIELCSIATLMKITSAFYKQFYFFTESIWSEKSCQVLHVKFTLVQRSTVNMNSILVMCPLKWEQRGRRSTWSAQPSYLHLKDMKPSGEP